MLISTGYLTKYVSKSVDSGEWIGTVVANNDPKGCRRVKVEVKGRLEGSPDSLPWAHLKCGIGLGGGNFSGWAVPNVGSKVIVSFQYGIYSPIVVGVRGDESTKIDEFSANYPASYGFKDEQGTVVIVDRAAGTLKLKHGPSGNEFIWNKNGDEHRIIRGNCTTTVTGDNKVVAKSNTFESPGKATIKCSTLDIL